MAVSKQPAITPETSSGEGLDEEPSRGEAKWKRFHPFRVVRKIFRRRVKRQGTGEESSKKSWSTSELQSVRDTPHKYEAPSPPYKIGLSVSHDSIFSPETSNLVNPEDLHRPQGSSLSVQHAGIKTMFKDELFSRVRARRDSDDDEEDVGLPLSPCTSPTTSDVLAQGLKSKPLKSGSLSAGSLVSMGSSENDEDSALASSSGNSSRMSLLDRRSLDFEGDIEVHHPVPLNHQAAHHKIAVRPKRTHGLPQKRLKQKLAASRLNTLPTTPEVIEDNCKMYSKSQFSESSSESFFLSDSPTSGTSSTLLESSAHMSTELESETVTRDVVKNTVMQSVVTESTMQVCHSSNKVVVESHVVGDTSHNKLPVTTKEFIKHQSDILRGALMNSKESPLFEEALNSIKEIPKESIAKSTDEKSLETTQISESEVEQTMDQNRVDPPRVSALVKNIERSDSMSKQTRDPGSKRQKPDKTNDTVTLHQNQMVSEETVEFISKTEITSQEEQLVCPIEEKQLEMEIRHLFQQQQKASKQQEPSQGLINNCNSYPEEESIMNDKCVSYEKKDVQSTQNRNSFAIDKSFAMDYQSQESSIKTSNSFDGNISNVVINSLASNVFNQRIVEDKVTISINSIVDDIKSGISKVPEGGKLSSNHQMDLTMDKSPSEQINSTEIDRNVLSLQTKPIKPESAKPLLKEKVKNSQKTTDPAKRVSVEIVPFNQRMKDQKYQPLIFPNKGQSAESTKNNNSNVSTMERNLSDRRVNTKNKDSEKNSNRHSFCGAVEVEMKQAAKPADKVHYPVQIRIHKSKTFEKENFDNTKIHKDTKKSPSPERISFTTKFANESKLEEETQKKWEVKVQSTSVPKREAFLPVQCDKTFKSSNKSPVSVSEPEQDQNSQSVQDRIVADSTLSRNRENTRKNTPDTSPPPSERKEAEPELMRVFARRSIKQKHCDKDKPEEKDVLAPPKIVAVELDQNPKVEGTSSTAILSPLPPSTKGVELQETTLRSPDLVKKKSKSFCEKDKQGPHVVPFKESGILRRPSLKAVSPELDNFNRRQRIASEPDVIPLMPPCMDNSTTGRTSQNSLNLDSAALSCRREQVHRGSLLSTSPSSTISNGSSGGMESLKDKEAADLLNRDGSAPSWLQLAQQRRELREQRERLLIGSSTNSFLEASGKPSRSSKVWDMVNNFQKMQMT